MDNEYASMVFIYRHIEIAFEQLKNQSVRLILFILRE